MTTAAALKQLVQNLVYAFQRVQIRHNANTSYVPEVLAISDDYDVLAPILDATNPFGTVIDYRAGIAIVIAGNPNVAVVFSSPVSSANYAVALTSDTNTLTPLSWYSTGKTVNGFNANIGAVAGTNLPVNWIAIPYV